METKTEKSQEDRYNSKHDDLPCEEFSLPDTKTQKSREDRNKSKHYDPRCEEFSLSVGTTAVPPPSSQVVWTSTDTMIQHPYWRPPKGRAHWRCPEGRRYGNNRRHAYHFVSERTTKIRPPSHRKIWTSTGTKTQISREDRNNSNTDIEHPNRWPLEDRHRNQNDKNRR